MGEALQLGREVAAAQALYEAPEALANREAASAAHEAARREHEAAQQVVSKAEQRLYAGYLRDPERNKVQIAHRGDIKRSGFGEKVSAIGSR